jgi:hypothetical protein
MPNRKETDSTVIRTRDLLYRDLEFQSLTPNNHNWSASAMAGDPPRLIRYQRLVAILGAFRIQIDVASFDKGAIIDVNNPAYEPLLSRARNALPESHVRSMDRRAASLRSQLRDLFCMLLEYRLTTGTELHKWDVGSFLAERTCIAA